MPNVIEQQIEEKPFDQAAFIKARNEDKAVEHPAPAEEKPPEKKVEEPQPIKVPRHIRRALDRARDEAAELRGRLKAYEELGAKPKGEAIKPKGETETDPEPQKAAFPTEEEYNRAHLLWEGRQQVRQEFSKRDETTKEERESAELQAHVREMDAKFQVDIKTIKDWEEIKTKVLADEDAPKYDTAKDMLLIGLLAHSDVRAFMLHHLATHPAEFQKLIDLRGDDDALIGEFKELAGQVKLMYSGEWIKKEAAQASDKPKGEAKERTGPENTEQARAPKALPRPSTEVAARGGTPPPEEPEPGSRAWMEKRNAMRGGR